MQPQTHRTGSGDDISQLDQNYVWHPFTQSATAQPPQVIAKAEGVYVHTQGGERLLDLISSWWVNLHGHAHPAIASAIAEQAHRLEHVIFAGYTHEPAIQLAARLVHEAPGKLRKVFYSDNGSTAVEVALKMALQSHYNLGHRKGRILAFEGGYHGDTFGAMSAGATSGFYSPFADKLFEVGFIPFPATWNGDAEVEEKERAALAALDQALGQDVAAILLEPLVQGTAGMRMCRPSFVDKVIRRVRAVGGLVIFDEVMTGFGRTGKLWAARHLQEAPDLMCLSKGITGGFLPLGVTLASEDIYQAFMAEDFSFAFAHGHSYTGNPLACAAALASLELTLSPQTSAHWQRIGAAHAQAQSRWSSHPTLTRVRQCGTVLAAEIPGAGHYGGAGSLKMREFFAARGLLLRPLGNVVYLLPPYPVTNEQLELAYAATEEAAEQFGNAGQSGRGGAS